MGEFGNLLKNPLVLAALGGYLGYRYGGKYKGAVGPAVGAAVGFGVGKVLGPRPAGTAPVGEYVPQGNPYAGELGQRRPMPAPAYRAEARPSTSEEAAVDAVADEAVGTLAGDGGLGGYGPDVHADDIDELEVFRDAGLISGE